MTTKKALIDDAKSLPFVGSSTVDAVDSFDFDFSEYEENVEDLRSLPFAQLLQPQGKISDAKKSVYGVFIKAENAEAVNFRPDHRWAECQASFEDDQGSEIFEDGFTATSIRMVVVRRSAMKIFYTETPDAVKKSWKYIGDAYTNKGVMTQAGQKAIDEPKSCQRRTMHLIFFVDDNNQPLHDTPFQFTTKGAFGGNFGAELNLFYKEVNTAFFKAAKKANPRFKGGQLNAEALALAVIDFSVDLRKTESGGNALYINGRKAAMTDAIGTAKTVKRKDTEVTLTAEDWRKLYIHKGSPVGQQIVSVFADYESFGEISMNEGATNEEAPEAMIDHTFYGKGTIKQTPEFDGETIGFELHFWRGSAFASQWVEYLVDPNFDFSWLEDFANQEIEVRGAFSIDGKWSNGKPVVIADTLNIKQSEGADW